jgi:tetratricopeptide (TPR) repeat protein
VTRARGTRGGSPTRSGGDTNDPYRAWVKGRLSLEALDATKLLDAVRAFEQAVAVTPDCAPAHAGLANASSLQFECTRAENAPNRVPLTRAIEHARRACELDPSLGEAWASLGFALTAAGEIEEARAAARRAATLEPTNWRHQFRLGIATWGEERLRAVDTTLGLVPEFSPARFLSAMVFIARQALSPAIDAAKQGSVAQARQSVASSTPFPAVGLHWLHGLLLMRDGHIGSAITEFAREIDAAQSDRIYSREYRVNAQVAAGFAHLGIRDAVGATEAFRSALETLPRNGRALIGLYQALLQTPLAPNASLLLPQIARSINELIAGGRPSEAALVTAALQIARGDLDAAGATIQQLLEGAPPGQTGWMIPIDPALAPLRSTRGFGRITALLAARAS